MRVRLLEWIDLMFRACCVVALMIALTFIKPPEKIVLREVKAPRPDELGVDVPIILESTVGYTIDVATIDLFAFDDDGRKIERCRVAVLGMTSRSERWVKARFRDPDVVTADSFEIEIVELEH